MICTQIFTVIFVLLQNVYCENGTKYLAKFLYEDLKCSPNVDATAGYNCNATAKNHCVFEGRTFEPGQKLEDPGVKALCMDCHCDKSSFRCTEDYCPGIDPEGCRYKYSFAGCCPKGTCEPAETNCTIDGQTHIQDELFYPDQECVVCICQKGFKGKLEEPYCIKRRCLDQLENMDKIEQNCAPVYFIPCCPGEWICNENQNVVKISSEDSKSELTCDFGKDKVPYGYGFETNIKSDSVFLPIRCECTLPPFITCFVIKYFHETQNKTKGI